MTLPVAHILVVDDDDVDREKFRRLAVSGDLALEIAEASSGAAALRSIAQQRFDLVVVDYRLGDTTGIELVRAIKQHERRPLPIIMVTGLGDERVAVNAIREGVYEYLTKANLTTAEIVKTITSALHAMDLEQKLLDANAARERAEQTLSQNRQQFEDARQLALIGTIDIDVESGGQSWSEETYRLLGDAPGSYAPSRELFLRRVHPDDREGIETAAKELGARGQAFRREFRIVRENGTVRHVLAHGRVTRGQAGMPHELVVLIQDVTALRTAELVAHEREAQIQGLFEASSMGLLIASMDGSILRVNPALCRLSGHRSDELAGMSVTDLLYSDHCPPSASNRHDFDGLTDVQGAEQLLTHKDGSSLWVSVNRSPVRGPDNAVSAVAIFVQDIRDRRLAETLLRASEQRFRTLVNDAPIGIFENDTEGNCTFVNAAWTQITGWPAERVVAANAIVCVHPEDRELARAECAAARRERRASASEFRFSTPDGRSVWVVCKIRPTTDETGVVTGYLGTIMDITERRLQQSILMAAKDAAEDAVRAKADFLARMSHEIRTPMNSVIGMTALALQGALDGEQREFLDMANAAAKSLLRLIDDILDFSRAEAGGLSIERVVFDLIHCVESTLGRLKHRAAQKGLAFSVALSEAVPRLVVGDAHRLSQILTNLVSNAIKFTDAGEVVVRVEAEPSAEGHSMLHFSIADTGIGIPHDKQAMIFEVFGQADESVSRRFGGAGLGLAICLQLVNLMKGQLWHSSAEGKGSTFHFSIELPLPSAAALPAESPRLGRSMGGPAEHSPLGGARLRILVAEDNYMNQRLIETLLDRAGHRVTLVADGRAALDQLALEPFDLVLMDVQMPGMDGIEAVKLLRAREAGGARRVPVLALTAQAMNGDAERCLEAGMDGYVAKPFDLVELEWAMRQMLLGQAAVEPIGQVAAPYDRTAIERRVGRDPGLFAELCGLFEPRAEVLLAQVQTSIEAREPEPLKRAAHELKGMLLNLAATDAVRVVRELEGAGRAAEYEDAAACLERLKQEVARLLASLRTESSAPVSSQTTPVEAFDEDRTARARGA